jgi:hypothetical protein
MDLAPARLMKGVILKGVILKGVSLRSGATRDRFLAKAFELP